MYIHKSEKDYHPYHELSHYSETVHGIIPQKLKLVYKNTISGFCSNNKEKSYHRMYIWRRGCSL